MRARRLFQEPVVDPSEPDEDMSGVPVSRVSDADGRWAYTLYDSAKHPFVHALDTERRTAVCIDLDDLRRPAGCDARDRTADGSTWWATSGLLARASTPRTHRVTAARREAPARAKAEASAGTPWLANRRAHGRAAAAGGVRPATDRTQTRLTVPGTIDG